MNSYQIEYPNCIPDLMKADFIRVYETNLVIGYAGNPSDDQPEQLWAYFNIRSVTKVTPAAKAA